MLIQHNSFKRRLRRSLIIGLLFSLAIPELIAAFLLPYSWVSEAPTSQSMKAPTYLGDIAPGLTSASVGKPANRTSGEALLGGMNIGVDAVSYNYGIDYFDPNFAPWDPTTSDTPPFVSLTRFRFGYPFRSLYWDDLSTGASVNIPAVYDYHLKMYKRAGVDRGIGVSFISPGRRLPIAPIWSGLIFNILFWTILWFVLTSMRRWVVVYRRKRRGVCLACGYAVEDLKQCPECGTECTKQRVSQAAC